MLPHWFHRYARNGMDGKAPETLQKRQELALAVGRDGFYLLDALAMGDAPRKASDLPEVEYFRRVWDLQFARADGQVKWRTSPGP